MEDLALLVEAAQAGDADAYSEIVVRLQDMAYGAAWSHLNNHHLAQDAAQEAFVEAFVHLRKLEEPRAFPGWFRQILFRQCVRLTRRKSLSLVPLEVALDVPSTEPEPHQVAEAGELREQVRLALQSLPEHERRVTQLFYMGGYSQKEISDFLKIPLTTVKKRLHSARIRLKQRAAAVQEPSSFQQPFQESCFAAEIRLRGGVAKGSGRTRR